MERVEPRPGPTPRPAPSPFCARNQLAFELYTREGLTQEEIGEALGYSKEHARTMIKRYLIASLREHGIEWRPDSLLDIRADCV